MKSKTIFKLIFTLLFAMFFSSAWSQNVASGSQGVKSYKKVSNDTVRLRNSVDKEQVVSGKAKNKTGKKMATPSAAKENKIDSLEYAVKTYRLGERVIMPGDSGRDVRSVAKILVNKIYIDEENLIYTADGGVLYKGELVRAVKHFQEFNGLHPDGIIGRDVVKALRKRK